MGYYAGSTSTLTATSTPADGSTTGTVVVTAPDGTTSTPAVTGSLNGGTWTGMIQVVFTQPGVWEHVWVIAGAGAGVIPQRIAVAPAGSADEWTYATTADYADHLRKAPPLGAAGMLADASADIDKALRGALYDVDDGGKPTNAVIVKAMMKATCEQAEFRAETGDKTGAKAGFSSVSVGGISYTRGRNPDGSQTLSSRLGPNAQAILEVAGLLPIRPRTRG